jgi:hypothetical protein
MQVLEARLKPKSKATHLSELAIEIYDDRFVLNAQRQGILFCSRLTLDPAL